MTERPHEAAANDTSAAVGYAPLTPTERLVFHIEQFLNGPAFKREFPDTGEDVKVLAVRTGRNLNVTVSMPFLSLLIRKESQYFMRKQAAARALKSFVKRKTGSRFSSEVFLNLLDRPGLGEMGTYLTLLGTSAEVGDSGEVGRGNRVCGVISLRRPASAEAAPGKNPVAHVGKIYSVLAQVLAEDIHKKVRGLREATVWITSQIGRPVAAPPGRRGGSGAEQRCDARKRTTADPSGDPSGVRPYRVLLSGVGPRPVCGVLNELQSQIESLSSSSLR